MITFASKTFDPLAYVIINDDIVNSSKIRFSRRQTHSATLDGLSVVDDSGFTHSDNSIIIKTKNITLAQIKTLERMIRLYSEIVYSEEKGVFLGSISSLDTQKLPIEINFSVVQELS